MGEIEIGMFSLIGEMIYGDFWVEIGSWIYIIIKYF